MSWTLSWKNVTTGWLSPTPQFKRSLTTSCMLVARSSFLFWSRWGSSLLCKCSVVQKSSQLLLKPCSQPGCETAIHIPLWSQVAYWELFRRRWASTFCLPSSSLGAYTLHPKLFSLLSIWHRYSSRPWQCVPSLAYPRSHPCTLWSLSSSSPSPEQWETPLALQP